jgi:hypothetical protein
MSLSAKRVVVAWMPYLSPARQRFVLQAQDLAVCPHQIYICILYLFFTACSKVPALLGNALSPAAALSFEFSDAHRWKARHAPLRTCAWARGAAP